MKNNKSTEYTAAAQAARQALNGFVLTRTELRNQLDKLKSLWNDGTPIHQDRARLFKAMDACGFQDDENYAKLNRDSTAAPTTTAAFIREMTVLEQIIDRAALCEDGYELGSMLLPALYQNLDKYFTPQEYMTRLVNRLEDPEDGWSEDTTRVRILKQFIKYGNCFTAAGYGSGKHILEFVCQASGNPKLTTGDLLGDKSPLTDDVFKAMLAEKKIPRAEQKKLKTEEALPGAQEKANAPKSDALDTILAIKLRKLYPYFERPGCTLQDIVAQLMALQRQTVNGSPFPDYERTRPANLLNLDLQVVQALPVALAGEIQSLKDRIRKRIRNTEIPDDLAFLLDIQVDTKAPYLSKQGYTEEEILSKLKAMAGGQLYLFYTQQNPSKQKLSQDLQQLNQSLKRANENLEKITENTEPWCDEIQRLIAETETTIGKRKRAEAAQTKRLFPDIYTDKKAVHDRLVNGGKEYLTLKRRLKNAQENGETDCDKLQTQLDKKKPVYALYISLIETRRIRLKLAQLEQILEDAQNEQAEAESRRDDIQNRLDKTQKALDDRKSIHPFPFTKNVHAKANKNIYVEASDLYDRLLDMGQVCEMVQPLEDILDSNWKNSLQENFNPNYDDLKKKANSLGNQIEKDLQKKRDRYPLVTLADELASGVFKTHGHTREAMYLFALVYGMTWNPQKTSDEESKKDIEVQLFRDYYCNHFLRHLDKDYRRTSSQASDPSGRGINFKNFAEMIYLYYIVRSDLKPDATYRKNLDGEARKRIWRIEQASKMINETIANSKEIKGNEPTDEPTSDMGLTRLYTDRFIRHYADMKEEEPEVFQKFIEDHYNCRTTDSTGNARGQSVHVMMVENDENTALASYKAELCAVADKAGQAATLHNFLWNCLVPFDPSNYEVTPTAVDSGIRETDSDGQISMDFQRLMTAVSDYLKNVSGDFGITRRGLDNRCTITSIKEHIQQAQKVTRGRLIVAYYYKFNITHQTSTDMTFEDVAREYETKLSPVLAEAHYQPINNKILFDMIMICASYLYIHYPFIDNPVMDDPQAPQRKEP